MSINTHAHITAWVLALVLFFVANSLHKSGKARAAKIVHMILRVLYIIVFATGGMLVHTLFSMQPVEYIAKVLIGLWVIAAMEMVLVRMVKGKETKSLWFQFYIAVVLVILLGLRLPLGFQLF
jgi:predicted membrane channel-forming protein YqfA (hemolysin III family)